MDPEWFRFMDQRPIIESRNQPLYNHRPHFSPFFHTLLKSFSSSSLNISLSLSLFFFFFFSFFVQSRKMAAAAVNFALHRVVDLYKDLLKCNGSAGIVNRRWLEHLEAEIDFTLDDLEVLMGQLGVIFAQLNPIPLDLDSYRSLNYRVRRKVIREQKTYWKTLLDDVTMPWNQ